MTTMRMNSERSGGSRQKAVGSKQQPCASRFSAYCILPPAYFFPARYPGRLCRKIIPRGPSTLIVWNFPSVRISLGG